MALADLQALRCRFGGSKTCSVRQAHNAHLQQKRWRVLVCAGLLVASLGAEADPTKHRWCTARIGHLEVASERDPDKAVALVLDLIRFETMARQFLKVTAPPLPLRIIEFRRRGDLYRTFSVRNVGGLTLPGLHQQVIAIGPQYRRNQRKRIAYHEMVHYLMQGVAGIDMPAWYNEGMASYLAGTEFPERGRARLGAISRHRLRRSASVILPELNRVDQGGEVVANIPTQALYPATSVSQLFDLDLSLSPARDDLPRIQAKSMALIHFLRLGAPLALRQRFGELGAALAAGDASANVFSATYGWSKAQLEDELVRYSLTRKPQSEWLDFVEPDEIVPVVRCLTRLETRLLLAEASMTRNPEGARLMFRQVLASEPGSALALGALARLEQDPAGVAALLANAIKVAPLAEPVLVARAQLLLPGCTREDCVAAASELGADLDRVRATSMRADLHFWFGLTQQVLGHKHEALAGVRRASELAPWSRHLTWYLAEVTREVGDHQGAEALYRKVARWHPDPSWRARAQRALARVGAKGLEPNPEMTY